MTRGTSPMDLINWLISNVATLLAALGLFLTVWTLRANHDWNRRNYAANLSAKWSEETGDNRKAIEKIRPGLIDLDRQSKKIEEITQDDARKIYLSTPDNSDLWELKFHFIALLNYFEVVASAYKYSIGDEKMIEEEFRDVLVNWYHILNYFIKEVAEKRGYQP